MGAGLQAGMQDCENRANDEGTRNQEKYETGELTVYEHRLSPRGIADDRSEEAKQAGVKRRGKK